MEADHYPDSANIITDEHLPGSSMKKNEYDISQSPLANTSVEPKKRSHSVLHWMQKTLTNVTASRIHHEHPSPRERSATTTQQNRTSSPRRSPPTSPPLKQQGRPRASTMDSVESTRKRKSAPKKIISDTDQQAQQSPSIFQFVFGR